MAVRDDLLDPLRREFAHGAFPATGTGDRRAPIVATT
jgi:hypothetical protein